VERFNSLVSATLVLWINLRHRFFQFPIPLIGSVHMVGWYRFDYQFLALGPFTWQWF
jgi:hypothetical protein